MSHQHQLVPDPRRYRLGFRVDQGGEGVVGDEGLGTTERLDRGHRECRLIETGTHVNGR